LPRGVSFDTLILLLFENSGFYGREKAGKLKYEQPIFYRGAKDQNFIWNRQVILMRFFFLSFLFFNVETSEAFTDHHFKKTVYDDTSYFQTAYKKPITPIVFEFLSLLSSPRQREFPEKTLKFKQDQYIFNSMKHSMKVVKSFTKLSKKATVKKQITLEKATLAGGCFWCVESDLEKLYGVKKVISGYAGGDTASPSYKEVSSGSTGHVEAVQIFFDPKQISYSQVLDAFWRKINPTDKDGQFVDRGFQYSTAIFYHDEEQKKTAEQSKQELQKKGPFKGT